MQFPMRKYLAVGLCLAGLLLLSACDAKNDVDPNATFPPGPSPAPSPSPTPVLTISQIVVEPETVLPGQSSLITVTATDGTGATLNYGWHATQGTVSASNNNLVTWTAPVTEGAYLVSVDVSNSGATERAFATIRVAANAVIQPLITTVLPGEVMAGDEVRILGSGFGTVQGNSTLTIGNTAAANIVSWSDAVIVAQVPDAAVTGAVYATVSGTNSTHGQLTLLWDNVDPANTAVSTATAGQTTPQMVSDGTGGMIVVWEDRRSGNAEIFAQRVNSLGVPLWTADGVVVCDANGDQLLPSIISDGAGGAIVAWQDRRNGTDFDIYAQRIDANGVSLWAVNGVQLSGTVDNQFAPHLVSDEANGAIVVWEDRRNGVDYNIFAQRVDGAGSVLWLADGESVVSSAEHQLTPRVVGDNAGGAIIVWADYRSASHYDVYAQRLIASGAPQWTANGVVVVNAAGNQFSPSIVADGAGGAVAVWQDYRNSADFDIYAQRLDANGAMQWAVNGFAISVASGNQVSPSVVRDDGEAFIVGWEDYRNGNADIYAQRISAAVSVSWTANGLAVCNTSGNQNSLHMTTDDSNGAILVWRDYRNGASADLYLQRINSTGTRLWGADGTAVSSAAGNQSSPAIIADGAGGALLAWEDDRNSNVDIYAQGISAGGKQ